MKRPRKSPALPSGARTLRTQDILADAVPAIASQSASPDASIWDTIFWPARYLASSSWTEHVPFAFWVVAASRPRVLVELGTKYGVSYFAFCQAVERLHLDTRCYAVDHWKGDDHTGPYSEEVFTRAKAYNDENYSSFSTLIRNSFDKSSAYFETGSIDLLHIDGLHTEKAVRHDFDMWLPKLSARGVLILHDTNVRERGFGVYKLFSDLAKQYPSFQFFHGHGLGVVGIGPAQREHLRKFFDTSNNEFAATRLRESFARLGRSHLNHYLIDAEKQRRRRDTADNERLTKDLVKAQKAQELGREEAKTLATDLEAARRDLAKLHELKDSLDQEVVRLEAALLQSTNQKAAEIEVLRARIRALEVELDEKGAKLTQENQRILKLEAEGNQSKSAVKQAHSKILALETDLFEKHSHAEQMAERIARLESDLVEKNSHSIEREQRIAALQSEVMQSKAELIKADAKIADIEIDLEKKNSNAAQMGNRIAALKDEIRRGDAYLEKVRIHFANLRRIIALNLAEKFEASHIELGIEAAQSASLVRYSSASLVQMLLRGVRAKPKRTNTRAWRLLYLHYLVGHRRRDAADLALMATSGLFDPDYYLSHYKDVAASGVDPLIHYMDFGAVEGRSSSPLFDTSHYLQTNPDVAQKGLNPLLHFITYGRHERRSSRLIPSLDVEIGDWTMPPEPAKRVSRDSLKPVPKRIVVYTAVSGGYDDLKPPLVRPPNCDFVVFSDHALQVEGWQVRPLNYVHHDPTRAARFVKLHPHVYFPDYDHSIWIDANIAIRGDVCEFLKCLTYDSFLGIFIHPLRDCIYVEGQECIKRKKDDPQIIQDHLARYREAGFPEHAGLWETNVLARRHNESGCIALMTAWWREMEIGSRRDQLSLPVVAHQQSVSIAPLGEPGANAREHPLLALTKHPSQRLVLSNAAPPPVLRKPVDVDTIPMDIGVCVYNSPEETKACLNSLIATRRPIDRILVVDDASDAPTATMLDQMAKDHEGLELIRHETNQGYTRSANDVFKNAGSPWVILLNSDAIVPAGALTKLIVNGEQFSRLGVVGPLSNAASWQTVPQLTGPDGKFLVNDIPPPLTIEDMDRVCAQLASGVIPFVPLVNGFCLAIRRSLLRRIGLFDEQSFPMGYGEEDDFCLRAGAAGYLCGIAADAYVFHSKSATFTAERRGPLVEAGAKALRSKHTAVRLTAAVNAVKRNPELARIRDRISEHLAEYSAAVSLRRA